MPGALWLAFVLALTVVLYLGEQLLWTSVVFRGGQMDETLWRLPNSPMSVKSTSVRETASSSGVIRFSLKLFTHLWLIELFLCAVSLCRPVARRWSAR